MNDKMFQAIQRVLDGEDIGKVAMSTRLKKSVIQSAVDAYKTSPKPKTTDKPKKKKDRNGTKKSKAVEIIKRMSANGESRQDILMALVDEAGLTIKGARTYLHNITHELGLDVVSSRSAGKMNQAVMIMEKYFHDDDYTATDVIHMLMDECGMTKAYASTAYYKIRKQILVDELD